MGFQELGDCPNPMRFHGCKGQLGRMGIVCGFECVLELVLDASLKGCLQAWLGRLPSI